MIKAVIFDYGGVVTSGGGGQGLSVNLSQAIGISYDEANTILRQPWNRLVRGQINEMHFWREIEEAYGKSISPEERNIFATWDEMGPRAEMLSFISELKSDGYITGLLSNVIPSTSNAIKLHGGYDLFDPCILSYKVGFAKPDVGIYRKLLASLPGVKPEEILFIDDQEKCMPPARTIGIQTIVATDSKEIISSIRNYL